MQMRGPSVAILAMVGALGAVAGPVSSAAAAPTLRAEYGTVNRISDGDTFGVRLSSGRQERVRMIGIQATELAHRAGERNQCGSVRAKRRLAALIDRKRVRLTSFSSPRLSDGRIFRFAAFQDSSGAWRDAGAILADEGLVLWEAHRDEWARNRDYNLRTSRAAAGRRGPLWRSATCGTGPSHGVPLKVWAQWEADGADTRNLNGEYVKIKNRSTTTRLPLGGWAIRDRSHFMWRFPNCASIAPGATVTIRIGSGTNDCGAGRFHFGLSKPLLGNPDEHGYGNGVYLLDPHTDIRGHFTYPCAYSCTDPLQGKLSLFAKYEGTEYVDVKNISQGNVNLEGYLVENQPYTYEIRGSTVLVPGQVFRLYTGTGTDSGLVRYWRIEGAAFANAGETVRVRTFNNITVGCTAWGTARC